MAEGRRKEKKKGLKVKDSTVEATVAKVGRVFYLYW
jgi:hypothetical protein